MPVTSFGSPSIPHVVYIASLGIGMATDIRARRVSNALVGWLLLIGIAAALTHLSDARSLGDALAAGGVGLALWLPFWLLGLLGAGDVKYFAAGAIWLGLPLAWRAALLAALLGGVMSVLVLLYQRGLRQTAGTVALQWQQARAVIASADVGSSDAARRTFPYAVPMGSALALAALRPVWLLNF